MVAGYSGVPHEGTPVPQRGTNEYLLRGRSKLCTGCADRALRSLWHTPARIVRKARGDIIRIRDGWPTAPDILAAYRHVAPLT